MRDMFLPIQHDNKSLGRIEEKQKFMWEQLHSRMDQRQKEWKLEMDELRKSFFRGTSLSPTSSLQKNSSLNLQFLSPNEFVTSTTSSTPIPFYHEFDVRLFAPDEICVRTQSNKLILQASHKELNMNKTVKREFKREIDIPAFVDPQTLQCSLTQDGRLVITTSQQNFLQPSNSQSFQHQTFFQQPFLVSEQSEATTSRDECESIGSSDGSCCIKNTPELATPLPDLVDNNFICSDTLSSDESKSSPKYDDLPFKKFNIDANIKSIYSYERPFNININLGKSIDPTQLKIDAINKILLVRVFMYDYRGHTAVWKVYLPAGLDPSNVAAHLTDEGHLILEENIQS